MSPHFIDFPWIEPSLATRITGTSWVGATLKLGGNVHSWCTRLNSRSIAMSSGDTYRPHIELPSTERVFPIVRCLIAEVHPVPAQERYCINRGGNRRFNEFSIADPYSMGAQGVLVGRAPPKLRKLWQVIPPRP